MDNIIPPLDLKDFALHYCSNKLYFNYTRSRWQEVSPYRTFSLLNNVGNQSPPNTNIFFAPPKHAKCLSKIIKPIAKNNDHFSLIFPVGARKSQIQKFLNIEILLTIFYIYRSKLARRNPSFASLKHHLRAYRIEMSNRSKAYRTMKKGGGTDDTFSTKIFGLELWSLG